MSKQQRVAPHRPSRETTKTKPSPREVEQERTIRQLQRQLQRVRRENEKLRDREDDVEEESAQAPEVAPAKETVCPRCGGSFELHNFGIREYLICRNEGCRFRKPVVRAR